jgi:hypothetical protein
MALAPVRQRKFKLNFFEVKLTRKYVARFSGIPDASCFDEVRLELREGEETEWRVAEGEGYSLGMSLSLINYFTAVYGRPYIYILQDDCNIENTDTQSHSAVHNFSSFSPSLLGKNNL